jgi:hypothetical protein
MEERLSLRELNHLYQRLSPEERDELLQGLLVAAPHGGEAMIKVPERLLLCHSTEALLDELMDAQGGEANENPDPDLL